MLAVLAASDVDPSTCSQELPVEAASGAVASWAALLTAVCVGSRRRVDLGLQFPIRFAQGLSEPAAARRPLVLPLGFRRFWRPGFLLFPISPLPREEVPPPLMGCTSEVAVLTTGHQTVKWPAEGNVWLVSPGDRLEHLNHPAQSRASGRSSRPPDQTKSEVRSLSF